MGILDKGPELIKAAVVARYPKYLYPLSLRRVQQMCKDEVFKTATKLGSGKKAHWWISSSEVLAWKVRRHASQLQER
jgi:hypothetical protein